MRKVFLEDLPRLKKGDIKTKLIGKVTEILKEIYLEILKNTRNSFI